MNIWVLLVYFVTIDNKNLTNIYEVGQFRSKDACIEASLEFESTAVKDMGRAVKLGGVFESLRPFCVRTQRIK